MKFPVFSLAIASSILAFALTGFAESSRSDEELEAEMSTVAEEATPNADNTAANARDRDGSSVTPLDQGNGPADLETTRRIRREIVGNDQLSIDAQNVKIVTANGRVTLRGPVDSESEKRLIGEIAERVARSGDVANQLEVKSSPAAQNP